MRLLPRLTRFAIGHQPWRDDVLADVDEEYADLGERLGTITAQRWRRRQLTRLIAQALLTRAAAWLQPLATLLFIGERPMSAFRTELTFALRALRRRPAVTMAMLLTLSIGLGVNAGIFQMIDALLLKPFPFHDVDGIAMLSEMKNADSFPKESVAPANYLDFKSQMTSLDDVSAYSWAELNISGGTQPERIAGFAVSSNFFRLLDVAPASGRFFTADDEVWGRHHEVVLSSALWQGRFASDPAILGKTIYIDSEPGTVVGIAPAGFNFPDGAEAWTPLAFDAKYQQERQSHYLTVFGRVKPGRALNDVRNEATVIYDRIRAAHPDDVRGRHVEVRTLAQGMADVGLPTILMMWQAAALFVLLIGCTNVVNLLLAQGVERQRELAVRLALGASRVRVVRQLLVESIVISAIAIPGAIAVASITLGLIRSALPTAVLRFVPGWERLGLSWPLLAWTSAGATLTGIAFGLLPAIQASRSNVLGAIKSGGDGGRSQTAGRTRNRMRRGLVVAQIALVFPLLIASSLAVSGVRTFVNGAQGYEPRGAMRASVTLPDAAYPTDESMRTFVTRTLEEVTKIPAITSVGTNSLLPASGSSRSHYIEIDGRVVDKEHPINVNYRNISSGYLTTMRIPVMRGRGIEATDLDGRERVAVISQPMARKYWPDQNAIGARLRMPSLSPEWMTVVGISGDIIDDWFANRNEPTLYLSVMQFPSHSVNLVIRTAADSSAVTDQLRQALKNVDPQVPAYNIRTLNDALKERTAGLRMVGGIMGAFGAIALLLATIGIYSMMAFYVSLRTKEMGLRLALGATPREILRMTLTQSARMSMIGIAIGVVFAVALARVIENAILGTATASVGLFALVAVALFGIATLASIFPAREATRVDPAATLRD